MDSRQSRQALDPTSRILREYSEQVAGVLASVPDAAELLRDLCVRHGWSEQDLTMWFANPTTRLAGARPVDVFVSEPSRVLDLAKMEMTTEW